MEDISFRTKEELKEILSSLPNETLYEIAKELNVKWNNTEKSNSRQDINRMRCYLALCDHYFPKSHREHIKNSGWKGKSIEELMLLLDKYNLKRPKNTNEKICRCWCIRRLNDAGVDPLKL